MSTKPSSVPTSTLHQRKLTDVNTAFEELKNIYDSLVAHIIEHKHKGNYIEIYENSQQSVNKKLCDNVTKKAFTYYDKDIRRVVDKQYDCIYFRSNCEHTSHRAYYIYLVQELLKHHTKNESFVDYFLKKIKSDFTKFEIKKDEDLITICNQYNFANTEELKKNIKALGSYFYKTDPKESRLRLENYNKYHRLDNKHFVDITANNPSNGIFFNDEGFILEFCNWLLDTRDEKEIGDNIAHFILLNKLTAITPRDLIDSIKNYSLTEDSVKFYLPSCTSRIRLIVTENAIKISSNEKEGYTLFIMRNPACKETTKYDSKGYSLGEMLSESIPHNYVAYVKVEEREFLAFYDNSSELVFELNLSDKLVTILKDGYTITQKQQVAIEQLSLPDTLNLKLLQNLDLTSVGGYARSKDYTLKNYEQEIRHIIKNIIGKGGFSPKPPTEKLETRKKTLEEKEEKTKEEEKELDDIMTELKSIENYKKERDNFIKSLKNSELKNVEIDELGKKTIQEQQLEKQEQQLEESKKVRRLMELSRIEDKLERTEEKISDIDDIDENNDKLNKKKKVLQIKLNDFQQKKLFLEIEHRREDLQTHQKALSNASSKSTKQTLSDRVSDIENKIKENDKEILKLKEDKSELEKGLVKLQISIKRNDAYNFPIKDEER